MAKPSEVARMIARSLRRLRWIGPTARLRRLPESDRAAVLEQHWRNG